jgi:hypothetical protein
VYRGGGLLRHLGRIRGEGDADLRFLAGLGQQPGRVSAQRLEHRIPGPAIGPGTRRKHQRTVDQPQHHPSGLRLRNRLGRVEGERSGKCRQRTEDPLLGGIQELVAPPDRGGQRALALLRPPVRVAQQAGPVVYAVKQLRHA